MVGDGPEPGPAEAKNEDGGMHSPLTLYDSLRMDILCRILQGGVAYVLKPRARTAR